MSRGRRGVQAVHPGAVALGLARGDVDVEGRARGAVGLAQDEGAHRRVPHRRAVPRLDADAVEAVGDGEEPFEHALEREVGAQRLLVEGEARAAELLRVVGDVPGHDRGGALALDLAAEGEQLRVLAGEEGLRLLVQHAEEAARRGAGVGHAILEDQIGEAGEAEERRLLPAQLEDAGDERAVVDRARRGARGGGAVEALAHARVVEVGEHRHVARRLEGEAEAGDALARRALARGGDRLLRQPGEAGLVVDDELEGVGGVEHVLREAQRERGQLHVERREALLARGIEIGAVAAEVRDGLGEEALARAAERGRLRRRGERLDGGPHARGEGDAAGERAHLRLHGVEGRAQRGRGGHPLQVGDHVHRQLQALRDALRARPGCRRRCARPPPRRPARRGGRAPRRSARSRRARRARP